MVEFFSNKQLNLIKVLPWLHVKYIYDLWKSRLDILQNCVGRKKA